MVESAKSLQRPPTNTPARLAPPLFSCDSITNDYPPIHNGLTTHNDPDDRFAIYRACSCLDSKETGSYSYGGKPPHLKGWRPATTRGSASLFTVLASI